MASVTEFPPNVPPTFGDIPLDGGRAQSISLNPVDHNRILVANQFGGLWMTDDRGLTWFHVDSLGAVFATDVAWAPDGNRVVATVGRDNAVRNGGGIWVSPSGTYQWFKPATADPPASPRVPTRMSAQGISFAPDDPRRVYVGTDYGVAVSTDAGDSWSHHMLETSSRVRSDRLQNMVTSIVGLPENRAVALTTSGVYRSDDGGAHWRLIRAGLFSGGFKCVDVSPFDSDKLFVLQDYTTLFLYESGAERWTAVSLPGGSSRGPFVRVSRVAANPSAFDIWIGAGVSLLRATCADFAAAVALTPTSWTSLGRPQGIHDDSGYLGLDENQLPLLYGSDGGLFRPTTTDATAWERAGTGATGLNSFLITDVAGTNVGTGAVTDHASLYFTTQDNGIWASPDGGATWPNSDCAEGFHMQVRHDAPGDGDVTVAYGKVGCGPSGCMFSDADLLNQRAVPDVSASGAPLSSMSQAFYVAPGKWIRYRQDPGAEPEIWISQNNGDSWTQRAIVSLSIAGVFKVAGPDSNPIVYAPFQGNEVAPDGSARVGLIRLTDVFAPEVTRYGDADLIYLPDSGSLGIRATEFDWHAIFGVDPMDANHLIAPDIHNQVVKISFDGGTTWGIDEALTRLVTDYGRLLIYDAHPYRLQVTQISFDPYMSERILVGTREAGVIFRDSANPWTKIDWSDLLLYTTGFFFKRDNTVVASTYGRGLWTIDFTVHYRPFPRQHLCLAPCWIRFVDDAAKLSDEPNWEDKDVTIFSDGRVSGLVVDGDRVAAISVTPRTTHTRYLGNQELQKYAPLNIVQSKTGAGFAKLPGPLAALDCGEVIRGVILVKGRIWGILSGEDELHSTVPTTERKVRLAEKPKSARRPPVTKPCVILSTSLPIAGLPVVGDDGLLHVLARDLSIDRAAKLEIRIDGNPIFVDSSRDAGTLRTKIAVPASLPKGQHVLEVIDRVAGKESIACAAFVTAWIDNDEGRA